MRELIRLIEQATSSSEKIGRWAFLYLPPKPVAKDFAQCGTCRFFLPGKEQCALFSSSDRVVAQASCGLYVFGEPTDDQKVEDIVTPEDAGYMEGKVRCENCTWFDEGSSCGLYELLNQRMGDTFACDEDVEPGGCCNAFESK